METDKNSNREGKAATLKLGGHKSDYARDGRGIDARSKALLGFLGYRPGRHIEPEQMDHAPPAVARQCLADLHSINVHWGGDSTWRKAIDAAIPGGQGLSLLDVGAGPGDAARILATMRPRATVVSLDYRLAHLRGGRGTLVTGDAFCLPFREKSFDYVVCSLFLHHFESAQIVELLASFGRIARKQVLVIDLWRNPIPFWFMHAARVLSSWHPIAISDGAISVQAALSKKELIQLAHKAGLREIQAKTFLPAFRIAMWAPAL